MDDFCCAEMQFHLQAGEIGLVYIRKFREFGLSYHDGGFSIQLIRYCPWCGTKLPESVADEWFEIIRGWGLEPDSLEIPEEFLTDEWWKLRKSGRLG